MKRMIALNLFAITTTLSFSALAGDTLSLSVGSGYSTGQYGTATSTNVWFYPFTATYRQEKSSVNLTIPYVKISGTSKAVATSGLGDIVLGATQNLYANPLSGWSIDLTGNIKFGTANAANGLGTGKNDYSLQCDFAKNFERADLFGTLGWRKTGDPAGIDYKDPGFVSLGAGYSASPTIRIGLAYDFRQRVIDGTSNFAELVTFVNYSVSNQTRIQMYVLKGYTDSTPDRVIGATLNWSY